MPSPPKPWEVAGGGLPTTTTTSQMNSTSQVNSTSQMNSNHHGSTAPEIPSRPSSLTSYANRPTNNPSLMGGYSSSYSPYGSRYGGYGSTYGGYGSGYGSGYGGLSSYSSPYNRYGSGYGGIGGGYGGYGGYSGGGYGGYSGGMYGMNNGGMYNGMPGDPNLPNGPISLSQRMEQGTAATFQIIESIVGAFGGFAQMLESTFMATHSSFFAMIGVAEQFGHLRNYLGQILSVFALIRWIKSLFFKMTGKSPPINISELNSKEFKQFDQETKLSKKPILIFFTLVFGVPWLMHKVISIISKRQEQVGQSTGRVSQDMMDIANQKSVDFSNLEFAKALYDFKGQEGVELSFQKGDVIAILCKTDPMGQVSQWWRGRMRSGDIGYFPSNYVEILNMKKTNELMQTQTSLPSNTINAEEFAKRM